MIVSGFQYVYALALLKDEIKVPYLAQVTSGKPPPRQPHSSTGISGVQYCRTCSFFHRDPAILFPLMVC